MIVLDLDITGAPNLENKSQSPFGMVPAVLAMNQPDFIVQNGEPVQIRLKQGADTQGGGSMTGGKSPVTDIEVANTEIAVDLIVEDVPSTGGRYYLKVSSATSGDLAKGRRYLLETFLAGDDFTNVGAGSNATGVIFIATGTTPTTWSHASVLREITLNIDYNAKLKRAPEAQVSSLTEGGIEVNKYYQIVNYVTGDDFSNVGAGDSATGIAFDATGTTPSDWTHGSTVREILTVEEILNATDIINGDVHLAQASPIAININFVSKGARTAITGEAGSLAPAGTTITNSVIRAGTSAITEIQQLVFTIPKVGEVVDLEELPEADGTVEDIQVGDTETSSVQRITLDPPPEAGSFSFILPDDVNGNKTAAWNISQADLQALVGEDYIVVKASERSWDIQFVAVEVRDPITLSTDGLVVPIGLSGEVDIDTAVLAELQAVLPSINPVLRVNYTPTAGMQRKLLSVPKQIYA